MSQTGISEQLNVEHIVRGRVHTLVLSGELDLASAPVLDEELASPSIDDADSVALDLRLLTFIDSTGVRATLAAREHCARRGADFSLIPGPPQVQRLFEVTGLLELLPFVPAPMQDVNSNTP